MAGLAQTRNRLKVAGSVPDTKNSPAESLGPVGEAGEFSSPGSIFCAVCRYLFHHYGLTEKDVKTPVNLPVKTEQWWMTPKIINTFVFIIFDDTDLTKHAYTLSDNMKL